jgi:methionyl-tRNA synthetase
LWTIARMITPVLPSTSKTLLEWLGDPRTATWPETAEGRVFPQAPTLSTIPPPSPLFPRLDEKMQDAIVAKVVGEVVPPKATPVEAPKTDATPTITYDDFAKLELRVGTVKEAVKVPKKDKLLHLQVDLGEGKLRSIVAGIAEAFAPDTLVGKQVIVVANLAPRKMAGLVSEGMILAAGDEAILGLSAVDAAVPPGTRVR